MMLSIPHLTGLFLLAGLFLPRNESNDEAELIRMSMNLPALEIFKKNNKAILMHGDSSADAIIFTYEGALLPDSLNLFYHGQKVILKKNMNELANEGAGSYGFWFKKIKINKHHAVVKFEHYPTWVDPKRFSYWADALHLAFRVRFKKSKGKWEVQSYQVKNVTFTLQVDPEEWLKKNYVPIH
jgi:hypothetical protein